jgi:hypothetical protein
MKPLSNKSMLLPVINLFTSFSTIICCALPALLVTIGAGAALAGLVSTVPQLVILSKYKVTVFTIAGLLILITGVIQWKNRNAPCPTDPELAEACMKIRKVNKVVYFLSVALYTIGFFFAFIAIHLFK